MSDYDRLALAASASVGRDQRGAAATVAAGMLLWLLLLTIGLQLVALRHGQICYVNMRRVAMYEE